MLGKVLLAFLLVIAALGAVGWFQMKQKAAQPAGADEEKRRQAKVTENVADLNDRFNRARYMGQDGNQAG